MESSGLQVFFFVFKVVKILNSYYNRRAIEACGPFGSRSVLLWGVWLLHDDPNLSLSVLMLLIGV